ncbi:MAG TPA: hypothetical protein VHK89_07640 [Actinomycetota bacterium]|nr:hypothetical protein [Actinomycetota bacterium]
MEANNGYEYRVVKVRAWLGSLERASERATERAAAEGWEAVNAFQIEGSLRAAALVLRRRADDAGSAGDGPSVVAISSTN